MEWILYVLLVLALVGDVLLAVLLVRSNHKQPKGDTAEDFVRAVTPVLQSETDLLAEQLRAMQGESARTTTATLRDFSAVLAENQRQNASASTARLESIDRAGAARQKAANDALLAQLTMLENRLKNLEDSNATRLDGVRGLRLPPTQPGVRSNYAYFPVVFAGGRTVRDAVCEALDREGVYARKYFYPLVTDFECYRGRAGFDTSRVPVARRVSDGVVTLPLYPALTDAQVDLICRVVREVLRHA